MPATAGRRNAETAVRIDEVFLHINTSFIVVLIYLLHNSVSGVNHRQL